jgi:RNA polymerase sigma factor (TIGR02999 family)
MEPILDKTSPVTELLRLINEGNAEAEARLLDVLYAELRKLAGACMRRERSDHTLQPTALVNEAYLRLVGQRGKVWQNRAHFLAVAGQVMRRVLVDYARARNSKKRAGNIVRLPLEENLLAGGESWEARVIDIDRALIKLAEIDPRQARIIEMLFFSGMTEAEVAAALGISERTVKRDYKSGRAWLYGELTRAPTGPQARTAAMGAGTGVKTGDA